MQKFEHGGGLDSVQQDTLVGYGLLECYDIGICELQAEADSSPNIATNSTGKYATKILSCLWQC